MTRPSFRTHSFAQRGRSNELEVERQNNSITVVITKTSTDSDHRPI